MDYISPENLNVLIIVDVQNCSPSNNVTSDPQKATILDELSRKFNQIDDINKLIYNNDLIVFTRDFHPLKKAGELVYTNCVNSTKTCKEAHISTKDKPVNIKDKLDLLRGVVNGSITGENTLGKHFLTQIDLLLKNKLATTNFNISDLSYLFLLSSYKNEIFQLINDTSYNHTISIKPDGIFKSVKGVLMKVTKNHDLSASSTEKIKTNKTEVKKVGETKLMREINWNNTQNKVDSLDLTKNTVLERFALAKKRQDDIKDVRSDASATWKMLSTLEKNKKEKERDKSFIQLNKGEFCANNSYSAFNYHDMTEESTNSKSKLKLNYDKLRSTGLWEYIISYSGTAKKELYITVCGEIGNISVIHTIIYGHIFWYAFYAKEAKKNISFIYEISGTLFLPNVPLQKEEQHTTTSPRADADMGITDSTKRNLSNGIIGGVNAGGMLRSLSGSLGKAAMSATTVVASNAPKVLTKGIASAITAVATKLEIDAPLKISFKNSYDKKDFSTGAVREKIIKIFTSYFNNLIDSSIEDLSVIKNGLNTMPPIEFDVKYEGVTIFKYTKQMDLPANIQKTTQKYNNDLYKYNKYKQKYLSISNNNK